MLRFCMKRIGIYHRQLKGEIMPKKKTKKSIKKKAVKATKKKNVCEFC